MPRAMNKGSEASTSKNLNAPESGSEGASQNAIGQVTKVRAATFHFTATLTKHLTLSRPQIGAYARHAPRSLRHRQAGKSYVPSRVCPAALARRKGGCWFAYLAK